MAWKVAAFRGYADHMDTETFSRALDALILWAQEADTTVLCAEALPHRCHRRLLADALLVRGWSVIHILAPGRVEPHRLPPFAEVQRSRLIYRGGEPDLFAG